MASSLNGTGVTFSDGTSQASAFLGGRGQVFTAGGTFTIPAGVTALKVTVVGGGGGGGGANGSNGSQSGAGGGGAVKYLTGLTSGATLIITVGAAGAAGAAGASGGAGGTSSVASGTQTITTIQATGGGGGVYLSGTLSNSTGGSGTGGDLNVTGGKGFRMYYTYGGTCALGYGEGGISTSDTNAMYASTGIGYGAGGGGIYSNNCSGAIGGRAGTPGLVLIEW